MKEECTCGRCPNCGHLSKGQRGCSVCKGGPEPGKVLNPACPVHGKPEIFKKEEE